MFPPRLDFRAANNEDWWLPFSVTVGSSGTPPWSKVTAWSDDSTYQSSPPASVVTKDSDLYVAVADEMTEGEWVDDEWHMIGSAELFTAEPLDLSGAAVAMHMLQAQAGSVDIDTAPHVFSSANGMLAVISPTQGGLRLQVPRIYTAGVPAGAYAYDVRATWPDGRARRVLLGILEVEQGITR